MIAEKTIRKPVPKVRAGQIALPTEHGGWGFLFEPIVAGLAIASTWAGLWIAVLTIGAFLTRQPLKILIVDRLGMKVDERARVALLFVLSFGAIFLLGLAGTIMTSGIGPLLPFAIVLPLAILQTYFDFARQSRRLLPELGGGAAISASVAAIVLAGGFPWPSALGVWAIFVARLVPSILYVRQRLLLEKGKGFSKALPIIAHVLAFLLVAGLAYNYLIPVLAVFAMLMLLLRCVEGLSAGRKKMKAVKIGIGEVIYGIITVLSVIFGYYFGL